MSDRDCVFKGVEGHQFSLNFSVTDSPPVLHGKFLPTYITWKLGEPVVGYPLSAKWMVSFAKHMSAFRGGKWDDTWSDLGLPFLMLLFLLPIVIWKFLTGTGYVPPRSHRASCGITMLLTNLRLLNRKNGPAGRVLIPCHFAAGRWRTS